MGLHEILPTMGCLMIKSVINSKTSKSKPLIALFSESNPDYPDYPDHDYSQTINTTAYSLKIFIVERRAYRIPNNTASGGPCEFGTGGEKTPILCVQRERGYTP